MRPYINPLTDASEMRQITIYKGKLFLVDEGNFIPLTSPIILRNGAVVTMEGLIKMPDGTTRILTEGEYVH
jgi:hypothetical protein